MKEEQENNQMGGEPGGFSMPPGYFDRLAGQVLLRVEWEKEQQAYPQLLRLRNKAVFALPDDYFQKNVCRLELTPYPGLRRMSGSTGMSVPHDYFAENEPRLMAALSEENTPLLKLMPKVGGFAVPPDYFERNAERLGQALHVPEQKRARVILLRAPKRVMWAAAALLFLVIGVWAYRMWWIRPADQDCGTIACVDKKDLLKARVLDNLETDELYELVNSEKLEQKLKDEVTAKAADSSLGDGDQVLDELMDGI